MSASAGQGLHTDLANLAAAAVQDPVHLRLAYSVLGTDAWQGVLERRWARQIDEGAEVLVSDSAAALLSHDEPVERWYGRRALAVEFMHCSTSDRMGAARDLLGDVLAHAGDSTDLVSLKIEASDTATLAAANSLGFAAVDVISNGLIVAGIEFAEPVVPAGCRVEPVDPDGLATVGERWMTSFRDGVRGYTLSRYRADARLGGQPAERVYEEWVQRAFEGEWADQALVYWSGDEPAAVLFYRFDPDVRRVAGINWCGRGLVVTRSRGRGIYRAFMEFARAGARGNCDIAEFDVHVANRSAMQAFLSCGFMRHGSVSMTLHRWRS